MPSQRSHPVPLPRPLDTWPWNTPYPDNTFINVPQVLLDYAYYIRTDQIIERPEALIVIGPPQYGKTEWARSITRDFCYMAGEWNPDAIDGNSRLVVIDNIPIQKLGSANVWKAFFGLADQFAISGRWRAPRTIYRRYKGFIYLCNKDPRDDDEVPQRVKDYINSYSHIVTLTEKLYDD